MKCGINEVGNNANTKRQTERHGSRQAGVRAVRGIGKIHECVRDCRTGQRATCGQTKAV